MISLKDKNVLLVNAFDDEIEQEGNGKYQLSFKYPTSDQRWENIELADLLLADDLHGEQEFRVFEIVKRNGYIFVYANQVVDDLNSYSISNISVDRVNGQTAMQALAGSIIRKHPFAFYSDIQDRHIFNQKNISVMDALANGKHSIVGQWGGDLVRDKYNVNLLKRGGRESEALFMYKKNLKSYTETNSIRGLFTRLNLSVKDSDIKTTVDSPLIGSYGGRVYELNIEVADQDVTTLEQLQEYGRNYFAEKLIDVPNNSLTILVTDNQEYDVRIFDMVFVHHEIFDKDLRMKITSYRFSPMGRKLKSVGFGKIKANLNQQVSNIATEVAEQSVSVAGEVFEEKLQKEIENADKVIDGKINKVRDEINDGIEQAQAEAERYADTIKKEITTEINDLDTAMQSQAQEHDRQVADILARTGANADLANVAKQLAERAQADLATTRINLTGLIAQTNTKAGQLEQSITSVRADVASQARSILAQAQAQTALTNRVTTVETLADGTRSTVTELSKTVNKATGDIASVSNRTKVVEDGLAGVKTSYGSISQKVNTQTGQITALNAKTAQLESGLSGIKEKFENIKIGSKNYFSQYLSNYDTSGIYAIRLVSETQPITITVTDKDTSVDVSGCYFGLLKDKAAKQGARWFLSKGTLHNAKKTIIGWPILAVYPKNQATLDKLFNRYKIMVEIGNISTDWVPAEEDFRHELATYVRNAEEDSAELSRRIETVDGKAVDAKTYAQQTAAAIHTRLESLETYKDGESTRTSQYFTASRDETARQLTAMRTEVTEGFVAKSTFEENARGVTERFENLRVGARNYIRDFGFANGHTFNNNQSVWRFERIEDNTARSGYHIKVTCTRAGGGGFHRWLYDLRGAEWQGRTMTYSVDVKASKAVRMRLGAEAFNKGYKAFDVTRDWQRFISTDTVNFKTYYSFPFYTDSVQWAVGDIVYIRDPQLEDGTMATTPSPAPEDQQSYADTKIAEYKNTVDGRFTTLQSETIPQVILTSKQIKDTRNDNQNPQWYWSNYPKQTVEEFKHSTVIGLSGESTYAVLTTNVQWDNSSGGKIKQTAKTDRATFERYGTGTSWEPWVKIANTGDLVNYTTKTEFQTVKETTGLYERIIGSTESGVKDKIARMVMADSLFTTEVKNKISGTETKVTQLADSYAIKNLTSSGKVLNQLNLNKDGSVKIDGSLVQITGRTYIQDGVISAAKIGDLSAGKITSGYLAAARIAANSITGNHIAFDEAFFNGLTANQANLKKLFAKDAFLTAVQAVSISASQITSGVMRATNNAMEVNLNAGQILYYTDQAALKRVLSGYPTQFVKFATGTVSGKGNAGVTVIGSNRWNSESSNDGGFVGIRAWNGANIDQIDVVGDVVRLASSAFNSPDGWDVGTIDSGLRIAPHNRTAERNSRIEVGDVWIMKGNGTYSSLRDILNTFNGNFSKGPNADSYTYYPNGF
ncbi:TPA: phage tail spike protein [Streptococcus suis]